MKDLSRRNYLYEGNLPEHKIHQEIWRLPKDLWGGLRSYGCLKRTNFPKLLKILGRTVIEARGHNVPYTFCIV